MDGLSSPTEDKTELTDSKKPNQQMGGGDSIFQHVGVWLLEKPSYNYITRKVFKNFGSLSDADLAVATSITI